MLLHIRVFKCEWNLWHVGFFGRFRADIELAGRVWRSVGHRVVGESVLFRTDLKSSPRFILRKRSLVVMTRILLGGGSALGLHEINFN